MTAQRHEPGWLADGRCAPSRRMMNDAAMQALGSYRGGRMLFPDFGTGLARPSSIDYRRAVELNISCRTARRRTRTKSACAAQERHGKKKLPAARGRRRRPAWRAAMEPDDNRCSAAATPRCSTSCPPHCRLGDNADAGRSSGFRAWAAVRGRGAVHVSSLQGAADANRMVGLGHGREHGAPLDEIRARGAWTTIARPTRWRSSPAGAVGATSVADPWPG